MTSGAELRREREAVGVSNASLARAIGVNPSTITRLEQADEVRSASAARYREALAALAAEQARGQEHIRAAAAALISAGESLVETGRKLAGVTGSE